MTLREMSKEYEKSAQLLRERLAYLRRRKKAARDPEEMFWIDRRAAVLTQMLRQMNEVTELTAHYYERGFYRNEGYRL